MRLMSALLLLSLAAVAQAGGTSSHGQPLPAGDTVPVATAIAAFDAHAGKAQRFSGRITEVCQAKGCWVVLEDNGSTARVMFRDHAFSVPGDASGTAVVYGVLSRKELTPEQAAHLAEDAGKGLAVEPVEYRITADGIEIGA